MTADFLSSRYATDISQMYEAMHHGDLGRGPPMTTKAGPLSKVRVVDMSRLSPGPYGSMLLADLGADVVVVGGGRSGLPVPAFGRGKEYVTLDLKNEDGRRALQALVQGADVFLEGFRPGVADRLGVGYRALSEVNPKLVYCSVTGYGQTGTLAQRAGHDINYLAVSGALGAFGPHDGPPIPPLNTLADFAGGGMLAAFGILAALFERERSGRGQYIDAAMIDGVMSLMAMPFADWGNRTLPGRGDGVLAGNMPAYRCYECADGRYVAVGALEDAFLRTSVDDPGPGRGAKSVRSRQLAENRGSTERNVRDAIT
ncbi:L-carnitine dehydratase/bile acid-inducible protein F [Mycolicibacterium smegmatis MC2 155]|uniref:L-carnitine dehydratase/bile acid-inducible protein F n=2 Tax=Mycolicibacterium smegmatis TaxID=1772 RepID=I7FNR5_MYCS2|nr:L-carnitine dehydratase/bile acid-inducible protein F [Mycolicibacterium smegmatis MC2 155]